MEQHEAKAEDYLPQETLDALKPIPEWLRKRILDQLFYEHLKGLPAPKPVREHYIDTTRIFFDLQRMEGKLVTFFKNAAEWQRKIEDQIREFHEEFQAETRQTIMGIEDILVELQAGKMKPNADTMNLVLEALDGHAQRLKLLEVKAGLRTETKD